MTSTPSTRQGDPEVGPPLLPRRAVCPRCRRPQVVCYCAHVPVLPTRTRVLLLQHPRERDMAIGTARMAHLSLPGSVLRVGLDFSDDPVVRDTLAGPDPVYMLFPGPGAIDVADLPRAEAVTLVVVDGTWWQAGKLLKSNPALAALPRVAFSPRRPSEYRIRRQPAALCVSTIEALAEVLTVLEPAGDAPEGVSRFDRLLDPFRAMIDRQQHFQTQVQSHRHQLKPRTAHLNRQRKLAARLQQDWSRLVCVQGEANAWGRRDPRRQEPEIVHWLGHRPATGESYEAVVAPRRPLGPATAMHIDVPHVRLQTGISRAAWRQSWAEWLRPDDVVVQWGRYYPDLAAADGLSLPPGALDLRPEIGHLLREKVGTVEACLGRLGAAAPALGLAGRGGRRLAALVGVLGALRIGPDAAA